MTDRIRVLHVIQNLNYGGMERVLSDIVRHADRTRFESHVLCLQYLGRFSEGLGDAAELHLAEPLGKYSMLWPSTLVRDIARIAPDVVHSHSGVWYKASLAARRAGVRRLVHTEHGRAKPDPWQHRLVDGLAARRTDVVVAVSDALASQLAADLRIPRRKIAVVPNGIDTDRYRPCPDNGALRRKLAIPPDAPIVGSIGRLEPIKGYDVMLHAFAELRAARLGGPRPVLVVAGDGSERTRLLGLARSLGLEGAVHLPGWRDDIQDLHAAFALFTMSSRSEGTSVSLLEAMSAGICPVVTDVGGNASVVGPALRHRLVAPENPAALAAAWSRALDDRERRCRDGALARERVLEAFGLGAMVRAYETIYRADVSPSTAAGAEPLIPSRRH